MHFISFSDNEIAYFLDEKSVSPNEFWRVTEKDSGNCRFFYGADMTLKQLREALRQMTEAFVPPRPCFMHFPAFSGHADLTVRQGACGHMTALFTCEVKALAGYHGVLSLSGTHNHAFFRCYGPEKDVVRKLLEVFRPEDSLTVEAAARQGEARLRILHDAAG